MIRSLLIANRGEIAIRIIRTCKDMGIHTVAVYSTADRNSRHVHMADEAVCIGPPASQDSYLNAANTISAACMKRCDAIHPGVGFLSENASFAQAVEDAGLVFVGPRPQTIALLGNKIAARTTALQAGLPITPGSKERLASIGQALEEADRIGYPVILKAASGGGGRGMRVVYKSDDMPNAIAVASREALSFFSDDSLLMEKFLERPRHVEMQLLADGEGTVVHLGERDCSVQKRHQKLIEESPSPGISEEMRTRMGNESVTLFRNIGYRGAGTIEFLVDAGSYYFMEVNARVQVEHPVSELVSMTDIIRQQLLIAGGKGLAIPKHGFHLTGHALECRINALCAGTATRFVMPAGPWVRVDTHLQEGDTVSPHYDALLAKIIVHAPDRQTAIDIMLRSLDESKIEGVKTNLEEQKVILQSQQFRSGRFGTDLYERLGLSENGGR